MHYKDEQGFMSIMIAVLIVAVIAVAGFAAYQSSAKGKSVAVSSSNTPSPTSSPVQSDKDLIVAVLKAHAPHPTAPSSKAEYILCNLEGNYAVVQVMISGPNVVGGGQMWLKKDKGNWSIAWEGQNYDPAKLPSELGFPVGFTSNCSSESPIIYSY